MDKREKIDFLKENQDDGCNASKSGNNPINGK